MFFPALEAAIRQAQQEIFLETYIFKNDVVGKSIASALEDAARRGVKVRLLVDAFGSNATPADFFRGMQGSGGGASSLPAQARVAAFEAPSPAPPASQAGLH